MKIKTTTKEIEVKYVASERMNKDGKNYPALKIVVPNGVSLEEIAALTSGSFEIIDDDGSAIGTHEGYTTLKETTVVIGKITTAEQQINELEAELNETNEALGIIVGGAE